MSDAELAEVARSLAHALMDYAYARKSEDKKLVNELQSALCKMVRDEEASNDPRSSS